MLRSIGRRQVASFAMALAIALPVGTAASAPVLGATTCKVTNAATGATLTSLKTAIQRAAGGATLKVSGVCIGDFVVTKNLTLQRGTKAGTLKGLGGTTLSIRAGRTVTVIRLAITGGTAPTCSEWFGTVCGGGIRNDGTLTLDGAVVKGNTATGDATGERIHAMGGGIYNTPGGVLTLVRTTVSGNRVIASAKNSATEGAGIANDGELTVIRSTISGNTATGGTHNQGGGIFNEGFGPTDDEREPIGSLTILASTISGNVADDGAGIYTDGGSQPTSITASTITDNSATAGGGIWNGDDAEVTVTASIVAGGDAATGGDCLGAFTSGGHNLVGDDADCTGFTDGVDGDQVGTTAALIDPGLGLLAKNGGLTRTHALLGASPAKDAAGDGPCETATDQRGVNRPQGSACDVGAFELQ